MTYKVADLGKGGLQADEVRHVDLRDASIASLQEREIEGFCHTTYWHQRQCTLHRRPATTNFTEPFSMHDRIRPELHSADGHFAG